MGSSFSHVRPNGRRSRSATVFILLALTLLSLPSQAAAQDEPAIDEYVEQIPTGGGDVPTGGGDVPTGGGHEGTGGDGGGGGDEATLPPSVISQIEREGGDDAAALRTLATSPEYGAPASDGGGSASGDRSGSAFGEAGGAVAGDEAEAAREGVVAEPPPEGALEAAGDAAIAGGTGPLGALLIALALISVAAFAF